MRKPKQNWKRRQVGISLPEIMIRRLDRMKTPVHASRTAVLVDLLLRLPEFADLRTRESAGGR